MSILRVRVAKARFGSPSISRYPGGALHPRELDTPRRAIAVAVIVIVACFVVGLTSDFLVDWAWFSAIGYLDVFGTILGGKAVLFFAVFAGSAILLWVNGFLASRFARPLLLAEEKVRSGWSRRTSPSHEGPAVRACRR